MKIYDYPLSTEFKKITAGVHARLDSVLSELNGLRENIGLLGDNLALDELRYLSKLNELKHQIKMLALHRQNATVFYEPFLNAASFDRDAVDVKPAEIILLHGILTLPKTDMKELEISSVRILAGNGMPGNAHQVYLENGIFLAREGLRADLSCLIDGNRDTWFEYEKLQGINGIRYTNTTFIEGYNWLRLEDQPLELQLQIETACRGMVGWIYIDPVEKNYVAPQLNSVVIDDRRGTKQTVEGGEMNGPLLIQCTPQPVKLITLNMNQPVPYYVNIGIPKQKLTLKELGVAYDAVSGEIIQPSYKLNDPRLETSYDLFTDTAVNVVPAMRQQIALRNIRVAACQYEAAAAYVSTPYQLPRNVSAISLNLGYSVPSPLLRWGSLYAYISIDDGVEWLPIKVFPEDDLPSTYSFGQYLPTALRRDGVRYLENRYPESVRVRIDLRRPTTNLPYETYLTPVVNEYTLTAWADEYDY